MGCIACAANGVRREAEVESRQLIDYFLPESLGLASIVKAIAERGGIMGGPVGA